MRTVGTVTLAVVALGFGLTSAALYWQLEAERSHAPALQAQKAPACEPLPPLAATSAASTAASLAPATPSPAAVGSTSVSAATSGGARIPAVKFSDEQRDYFARKRYAPLFRELALSDDDIAALVPLLSEQEQRLNKPIPKTRVAADGSILPDPDGPRQSASDRAEIAALIGPDRAAQLMESRKSLPARLQVRTLRSRLEDSNEPLTEEQYQRLMTMAKSKTNGLSARFVEGESPEENMNRMHAWQDETERQLHEDAASVLTPNQMRLLDEEIAAQKNLRSVLRPVMRPIQASAAGAAAP